MLLVTLPISAGEQFSGAMAAGLKTWFAREKLISSQDFHGKNQTCCIAINEIIGQKIYVTRKHPHPHGVPNLNTFAFVESQKL
jgi:hypothetical protein